VSTLIYAIPFKVFVDSFPCELPAVKHFVFASAVGRRTIRTKPMRIFYQSSDEEVTIEVFS
jgi:hypothetical protein